MQKEQEILESSLKRIFKSSVVVFIGLIFSKIFTLIYRILIANKFSPEIYGLFSLTIMILGWFVAFSVLGLTSGLLRYVSLYRGRKEIKKINVVFRFSTIITLLSSVFFGLVLYFGAEIISIKIFHNSLLITFLKIASIGVPLSVLASCFLSTIKSYEKIKIHTFLFHFLQNFLKVFFLGIFIFLGLGIDGIMISYIISIFIVTLFSVIFLKIKIPSLFKKYELPLKDIREIKKSLLNYSIPLLFYGIISSIFYWTDTFLIGYFKDASSVGFYNAAIPIAAFLSISPLLFMQLFFPLITKHFAKNDLKLIRLLSKQVGKWIIIANIPLLIILIFFPGVILNLFFNPSYIVATTTLIILSMGAFISAIFTISHQMLSIIGKTKILFLDMLLVSILNIILNIIFIPSQTILGIQNNLGINGAALATIISIITLNLLFFIQSFYFIRVIPFRKNLLSSIFAGIIATIFLFVFREFLEINIFTMIIAGIAFCVIYFCFLILFKGFDKNDMIIVESIRKKFSN